MKFKPLVTDEAFKAAEADLEAISRAVEHDVSPIRLGVGPDAEFEEIRLAVEHDTSPIKLGDGPDADIETISQAIAHDILPIELGQGPDADLQAFTEAVAHEITQIDFEAAVSDEERVRPEIKTRIRPFGFGDKLLGWVGIKSGIRRVNLVNKIARTVEFSCGKGLYERSQSTGTRAFDLVAQLHTKAVKPKVSERELFYILGWVQAIVVMTCPGVTASKVRSI